MHESFAAFQRALVGRSDARLDTSLELLLERAPITPECVLATVVATAGSTYRKQGARMLIMADGSYFGLLSGGCFESDLSEHAREVMKSNTSRAIEYDMRGPDDELFGLGAGCEGALRVLLEPAGVNSIAATALASAGAAVEQGEATALVMVHESSTLKLGTYPVSAQLPPPLLAAAHQAVRERASRSIAAASGERRERAFVQYVAPAPHLLLCGGAPDAQSVVSAARTLGWRVTVVDHRPAYARPARFPGATVIRADSQTLAEVVKLSSCHAAVVMSHHLKSDEHYLRALAASEAPAYIGLLGPKARRARLMQELGADAARLEPRLRGPVGIDLGGITPEAIALSIVAQIHAWLAGRDIV